MYCIFMSEDLFEALKSENIGQAEDDFQGDCRGILVGKKISKKMFSSVCITGLIKVTHLKQHLDSLYSVFASLSCFQVLRDGETIKKIMLGIRDFCSNYKNDYLCGLNGHK